MPRIKRSDAEQKQVESAGPEFLEALARGLRADQGGERLVARQAKARRKGSLLLAAPLVRARKGHHRPLAEWAETKGLRRLRCDGRLVAVDGFAAVADAVAQATAPLAAQLAKMGLTEAQIEGVLALSRDVVERVAWEVVPVLAETIIKEELKRLTA